MVNISKIEPLPKRDLYYYRRRFVNRVYSSLAKFFAEEAEEHGATKAKIAKRLDIDPAQVTRWLGQPSNMTLESLSDVLLALDAEAEPPEIVPFRNRATPNYAHDLIARVLNRDRCSKICTSASSEEDSDVETYIEGASSTSKSRVKVSAA